MTWRTKSTDSADTERLGELLGKLVSGGEVIDLVADLGGGKTTFVRGLARGLGSKDTVTSPTFTLSKIYKAKDLEIHHFDFYRLNEPGIVADQLKESLDNPKVVTVIEWAKIVKEVLPDNHLSIEFKPVATDPEERSITVKYPEAKRQMLIQLETAWQEIEP